MQASWQRGSSEISARDDQRYGFSSRSLAREKAVLRDRKRRSETTRALKLRVRADQAVTATFCVA